ncbi:50S ribosomal protein L10 [Candidatus Woesearchaeota archaeon]|nr:50S ribosomal protein L10 [Candidatus Woesearchaeota archaeon]
MKAHVSDEKKKVVSEFTKLLEEYPVIGSIDLENLPASQLQRMREQLRGKAVILMTKRRLLKIAIDKAKDKKKGLEKLSDNLRGMSALIFTKDNPFKLYNTLQKSKSSAPAKPGQIAPNDIVVEPGPTSFVPGPIIGELGALGIKSAVENGKITIKERSTIVKDGEEISKKAADILTRLGIEPMEVGINLVAVYENGEIFKKDILAIDEQEFMDNISKAASWSLNLAVEVGFPTKETVEILIKKAYTESKALALSENILADAVVEELLAKANSEMMSVKSQVKIEEPETPKEEVKEEKEEKPEEKKEEEKKPEEEVKKEVAEEKKEDVPEDKTEDKEETKEEKTEEKEEVKEEVKEEKPEEEKKDEVKEEKAKEEAPEKQEEKKE